MKFTSSNEILLTIHSPIASSLYRIYRSTDADLMIPLSGIDRYLALILHHPLMLTSAVAFSPSYCLLLTLPDAVNMKRMYDQCIQEIRIISGIPENVDISGMCVVSCIMNRMDLEILFETEQ